MASLGIQPSLIKTKRPTFSHLDQTQVMVRLQPKRLTISFKPLLLLFFFWRRKLKISPRKKSRKHWKSVQWLVWYS